jgi:hypothetical protein
MDKKNLFWMIGMFLVGAVIGGVIMCLVCCNCNNSCKKSCKESCKESCKKICGVSEVEKQSPGLLLPVSGPLLLSVDSAKAYFKCYMKTPLSIDTLVAFTVNLQQLQAMQTLLAHNSATKGFRIYFGIVGDPTNVNMVVATDSEGRDVASEVYMTDRAGPCPDLCDKDSPITK